MPSHLRVVTLITVLALLAFAGMAGAGTESIGKPNLIQVKSGVAQAQIGSAGLADIEGYLKVVGRGAKDEFFYAWAPALKVLEDRGIVYSVLLSDADGVELYMVPKASGVDRGAVEQASTILSEDDLFYLVSVKSEDTAGVEALPAKQLLPRPWEAGFPLQPARMIAEAPAYAPLAYNSTIQATVDAVSQSNLYTLLSGLSGENAVVIGGEPYTIATRYSTTEGCRKAAEHLKEQFEALGVAAEYDYFNFRKWLTSVDFPEDNLAGWVVGSSLILRTDNGGQVWYKLEDGTEAGLRGIFMLDNETGCVVGEGGTVLLTDNGATWQTVTTPTTYDLKAVFFVDASVGYCCGAGGTILKSTNGGHSWSALTSGTTRDLNSIYFTSITQGWVVGAVGTIRRTSNGGSTWQTVTSPATGDLNGVVITSATTGAIVGDAGVVLRTLDGAAWQTVTSPVTDDLSGLFFISQPVGWACGNGGAAIRTLDGGATWSDLSSYISYQLSSMHFANSSEGWMVGNAVILHSLDGGVSWEDQSNNIRAGDVNVVATLPGTTHPEEIYIVCAHYDDTSPSYMTYAPGADDNGTGTIATVEAARVLKDLDFEATLKFVCFSREEQGLVGSAAYAREASERGDSIRGAVNFDMIGYVDVSPEDIEILYNGNSLWLADAYEAAAGLYVPDLLVATRYAPGMSGSDNASFWSYGYSSFCGIEDLPLANPYYHRTGDRVSTLNFDFYTDVVKSGVATLAELARLDTVSTSVPAIALDPGIKVGPNPARGEISIEMAAGGARAQTVDIYDVAGRLVTSVRATVENGLAKALWQGDDASGARVSAGIYFVKVQGHDAAVKIVLVK